MKTPVFVEYCSPFDTIPRVDAAAFYAAMAKGKAYTKEELQAITLGHLEKMFGKDHKFTFQNEKTSQEEIS